MLKNPANAAGLEALVPAARTYSSPDGAPVAYLCHHFTCLPGFQEAQDLAQELEQVRPGTGGPASS